MKLLKTLKKVTLVTIIILFFLPQVSLAEMGVLKIRQLDEDFLYKFCPFNVDVINGSYVEGTVFSLKWVDEHYYVIDSENGSISAVFSFENVTAATSLDQLRFIFTGFCNISGVTIKIQAYNFTKGEYAESGEGFHSYASSIPVDEDILLEITSKPRDFLRSGETFLKVTAESNSSFQLKINRIMLYYSSMKIEYGGFAGYVNYLKNMYVAGRGFRCHPVYNSRGSDYFNYWMDDHGKLLLAFTEEGLREYAQKCVEFIRTNKIGSYLPGRVVDSSIYVERNGSRYFVTNRIVGVGNFSALPWGGQINKVYEKEMAVAHSIFTPDEANYAAGLFLFDADMNETRFMCAPPLDYDISIISNADGSVTVAMNVTLTENVGGDSFDDAGGTEWGAHSRASYSTTGQLRVYGENGSSAYAWVKEAYTPPRNFESPQIKFYTYDKGVVEVRSSGSATLKLVFRIWESESIIYQYEGVIHRRTAPGLTAYVGDHLFKINSTVTLLEGHQYIFEIGVKAETTGDGRVDFYHYDSEHGGQLLCQIGKPGAKWIVVISNGGAGFAHPIFFSHVVGWVNATVYEGNDYVIVKSNIVNKGPYGVRLDRFGVGLGSLNQTLAYYPYYSFLKLENGTVQYISHPVNTPETYYIWNSRSPYPPPVTMGFTGYKTPEFAKGFLLKFITNDDLDEINYVYNLFGVSVRVVSKGGVLASGEASRNCIFYVTALDKFQMDRYEVLLDLMENIENYRNYDISMSASWGIVIYALAKYAKSMEDPSAEKLARQLWNAYYQEVFYQPTYAPPRIDRIYYRSLYTHALAGLVLDPHNSTFLSYARLIADKIMEWQIMDPSNPAYGRARVGLEENGWAYALLRKLYMLTGNSTYNERAELILRSIKMISDYDELKLYNINEHTGGICSESSDTDGVFRSGEMLYALIEGGLSWSNPVALHAASLIWKFTRNLESGFSIAVDPASGHSNTETQPLCYIGLRSWARAMAEATAGVHIKYLYGATITSAAWRTVSGVPGKQLEIRLEGSGDAVLEIYAGHWNAPNMVTVDGKAAEWAYVYSTNTLSIRVPLGSEHTVMITWAENPTTISYPITLFRVRHVDLGALSPGSTIEFNLTVEFDAYSVIINRIEWDENEEWFRILDSLPKTCNRLAAIGEASIRIQLSIPEDAEGQYDIAFTVYGSSYGRQLQSGGSISFTVLPPQKSPIPIPQQLEEIARVLQRALGNPIIVGLLIAAVAWLSYYSLRKRR